MASQTPTKVILVGIGGPTCSGKTTLAKHLRSILPTSFIIHQDDFAPPQDLIPIHPVHQVQDWDDAPGAIDWPRLRASLKHAKVTGALPEGHYSHDYLNEQKEIPVEKEHMGQWVKQFKDVADQWNAKGFNIVWALLDGFLLYWDKAMVDQLDVKLFIRIPEKVLYERRNARHGYHTADQSNSEGSLWRDPPHYWEQIVYPAYVRAHEHLFEKGDVEDGKVAANYSETIVVLPGEGDEKPMSMDEMVEVTAKSILYASVL